MIDTHSHVYSKQFDTDRDTVIESAVSAGVQKLILPNVDKTSFNSMMSVCAQYPTICFPSIGLHPTSVKKDTVDTDLSFMEEQMMKHRFKAVGEIGIDCYWTLENIDQQRMAFERQVKLALTYKLPIIIHAREAFHEIFPLLDRLHTADCRGVFHSFTGTLADYKKIKEYGTFMIGLGGVLTFKKSHLPEIVSEIPLSEIVLETDAPYLAPHPYRGKRNESAYMKFVAIKLAEIKGITFNDVDEQTDYNAKKLFDL